MSPGFEKCATGGEDGGSYLLWLWVGRRLRLRIGALGRRRLPAGRYVYVGSARRGISARVARHLRRATGEGGGRPHWHVDYLLAHPAVSVESVDPCPGRDECELSRQIAAGGLEVPVPGFGATDCRDGCQAHLYRIPDAGLGVGPTPSPPVAPTG